MGDQSPSTVSPADAPHRQTAMVMQFGVSLVPLLTSTSLRCSIKLHVIKLNMQLNAACYQAACQHSLVADLRSWLHVAQPTVPSLRCGTGRRKSDCRLFPAGKGLQPDRETNTKSLTARKTLCRPPAAFPTLCTTQRHHAALTACHAEVAVTLHEARERPACSVSESQTMHS